MNCTFQKQPCLKWSSCSLKHLHSGSYVEILMIADHFSRCYCSFGTHWTHCLLFLCCFAWVCCPALLLHVTYCFYGIAVWHCVSNYVLKDVWSFLWNNDVTCSDVRVTDAVLLVQTVVWTVKTLEIANACTTVKATNWILHTHFY